MKKTERFVVRIRGRVQGVFFRKSTLEKAREIGINGFVQNESDGSVYLEAEGEAEKLRDLLAWVKKGPPDAEVQSVSVSQEAPAGYRFFEVRH